MASTKTPEPEGLETEEVDEPQELEKLESEVKEMSEKILQYRASLPDKLKDTFVSLLAAQRPILPEGSEPGTSGDPNPDAGRVTSNIHGDEDQETIEKIRLLKDKISSNASSMPVVLKRMRESGAYSEAMLQIVERRNDQPDILILEF
ncbi:hypothetical protein TorRG33x02_121430 [Trema orientale]|uniref:Uncharacterized protein n=1 Tax=Trema orientale TaxID=63057 RepID=A0A2P5F2Q6_TREOI|nr:hypothetical protein TorRG33x02_121430 [Trema orientale]